MGDCSDSISRRREIRKRRILENAELRKQKIFGINSNYADNSSPNNINSSYKEINNASVLEDLDDTASVKSVDSEVSSKSLNTDGIIYSSNDINRLSEILRNIPDPLLEFANEACNEQIEEEQGSVHGDNSEARDSRFINSTCSPQPSNTFNSSNYYSSSFNSNSRGNIFSSNNERSFTNATPNFLLVILDHPAAPCFLALIVSFLLLFDFGKLVSNSLIIPFIIWEIQQIIASYGTLEIPEESPSLLEAALLLCGIRKGIITKYIWISKLLKDIKDDFALYVVTIVLWQIVIGYHSVVQVTE